MTGDYFWQHPDQLTLRYDNILVVRYQRPDRWGSLWLPDAWGVDRTWTLWEVVKVAPCRGEAKERRERKSGGHVIVQGKEVPNRPACPSCELGVNVAPGDIIGTPRRPGVPISYNHGPFDSNGRQYFVVSVTRNSVNGVLPNTWTQKTEEKENNGNGKNNAGSEHTAG